MASLKSAVSGLDQLRHQHAELEAAAAEGERLATLNSELRLSLLGTEDSAEEHDRLERLAREVDAVRARNEELRQRLREAPSIQVGRA